MTIEGRRRRIEQKADIIRHSEGYRRDLWAVRVKWNIPAEGFLSDEAANAWLRSIYESTDAHEARYHALFREAYRRDRNERQLESLAARATREDPINRLHRDIRDLNRRYDLGEEFGVPYFRLMWESHLAGYSGGGIRFSFYPPSIIITPDLTRRDVEEAFRLGNVRVHQEMLLDEIPNPKGGRPRRGEKRCLTIEDTGKGEPRILLHGLTWSLVKREWHKVNAVQKEHWPEYSKEHYKPAHQRRMRLVRLGGLDTENTTEASILELIDSLFEEHDWLDDRRRRSLINQDRRRLRGQLEPPEE